MARLITRANQRPDVIYRVLDEAGDMFFVSPDGEGRFWYDTLAEAQAQHGDDLPIVRCVLDPRES